MANFRSNSLLLIINENANPINIQCLRNNTNASLCCDEWWDTTESKELEAKESMYKTGTFTQVIAL